MSGRVLIVEDNPDLAEGLAYNLRLEGLEVAIAGTGEAALEQLAASPASVIVLDLMLPGIDGYEVLRRVRATGDRTPVLILSARAEELDKVRGFRLDADQYVTKPFALMELLERIKALHRRTESGRGRPTIAFADVVVDPESRTVQRAGRPVSLSPKAFNLLLALIRREGAVASRVELLREVWGHRGLVLSRTVDAHVAELRRKLEADPAEPRHILTVWKTGYRFSP